MGGGQLDRLQEEWGSLVQLVWQNMRCAGFDGTWCPCGIPEHYSGIDVVAGV